MSAVYNTDWDGLIDIIAYGLGQVGKRFIRLFDKRFNVRWIVDNGERCSEEYCGIPVISLEQMMLKRKKEKIIVFASRSAFFSIRNDLIEKGLKENKDFCKLDDFIRDWYWQFEEKNCLREVHMAVSTNCTFQCKYCNMFMPYYKQPICYNAQDVAKDLSLFFERIDYVFSFAFLGGEPFLNQELEIMIEILFENYREKVGQIEIITNGSLIPEKRVLETLKKCKVMIRISDYTKRIPYTDRMNELCSILDSYGICYSVEESLQWTDFCFPECTDKIEISNVRSHMLSCAPEFHGLNDGKFYYCHVSWSAEKAGIFKLKGSDFIRLEDIDNNKKACRKIVEYADGNMECGYVSLCEKCMGCGMDNNKFVLAGEQISR